MTLPNRTRATDEDRQIGQAIAARRTLLGITQQQLADAVDVTYQQIHKYERGINRVAAGRLWKIARALGVTLEELTTKPDALPATYIPKQQIEMAQLFAQLRSKRARAKLLGLLRVMVEEQTEL